MLSSILHSWCMKDGRQSIAVMLAGGLGAEGVSHEFAASAKCTGPRFVSCACFILDLHPSPKPIVGKVGYIDLWFRWSCTCKLMLKCIVLTGVTAACTGSSSVGPVWLVHFRSLKSHSAEPEVEAS